MTTPEPTVVYPVTQSDLISLATTELFDERKRIYDVILARKNEYCNFCKGNFCINKVDCIHQEMNPDGTKKLLPNCTKFMKEKTFYEKTRELNDPTNSVNIDDEINHGLFMDGY